MLFSSTKPSTNVNISTITSPPGVGQLLPLKLADKKVSWRWQVCDDVIDLLLLWRDSHGFIFIFFLQSTTAITPNHSRTGSSPAVIQNPILAQQSGNPATRWDSMCSICWKTFQLINCHRTNTYPKIPERYRLRSTDGTPPMVQIGANQQSPTTPNKIRSVSLHGQSTTTPLMLTKVSPNNNHLNNSNNKTNDNSKDGKEQNKEEEVIYFWYKPTEVEI